MKVDFIFDFASPNAYCCHKVIPEIHDRTGIKFNYIHCLLGGIFKLTNNQAPMIQFSEIKNKLDYEGIEMERFMKKHNLNKFKMNSNFPITTVGLQRGALVAEKMGFVEEYRDKVLQAMWEDDINLGDQEILMNFVKDFDKKVYFKVDKYSSISTSLSFPKKILSLTKKVGTPKEPLSTAMLVLSNNCCFISSEVISLKK